MARDGRGSPPGRGRGGDGLGRPYVPYHAHSVYMGDWYPGRGTDGDDKGNGFGNGNGYITNGVRP